MDPQASFIPVKNDDAQRNVSSSSSMSEISSAATAEGAPGNSDEKDNKLVERVQGIALGAGSSSSSKTEWTTSTASIHLTTSVSNKAGVFEEEEEGELDYEEDEGEIHGVQEDRNGVKNDADGDKEEGELEEDEQEEEGEEGEIISDDDDNKATTETKTEKRQHTVTETDGPEEGELIEEGESSGGPSLSTRKKVCRYFTYGGCTWGMACRFLHPGVNDKGAYQMLPAPGQYPSPFPKAPAVVPPVPAEIVVQAHEMPPFPDQDEGQADVDVVIPEVAAPPKKETAWERGLKLAKEIKKAAQKRKEEDADFEQKRMSLGITAEEDDDENDKENMMRRREMIRTRMDKDFMIEEDDLRHRRGGDIVSQWRDKKQTSPTEYRDRDRRKKRVNRSPSSSPERDRWSRRRGGGKEKQKGKGKESVKERDKEREKRMVKETERKREEKAKKPKEKGSDSGKEKTVLEEGKKEIEVAQEKAAEEKEQTGEAVTRQEIKSEEKKDEDERKKATVQETSLNVEVKPKEAEKRDALNEGGAEDKDKPKSKALGISSSRLPNDEWIDPWQRTTSPKRQSVSSRSSRSRSSSSSSDSSRSSRSRSHSGSESRSTSRSASRSRSRSVSQTPSRSPSRSRSGSRSKSHSRSGSVSSASDHSSSSSSNSPAKETKTVPSEGGDEKGASHESSESESDKSRSKSKSPTPVRKIPAKPKTSPGRGPRTPPGETSVNRSVKERKNRLEFGRGDRMEKWQQGQIRQWSPWNRRGEGARPVDDPYSRERGNHSRRRKSPERRRRSRSPRSRNEDRRRLDERRTRERSSSADSMEHALARPSSPRATRERGGMRGGSSASSSSSESESSGSGSESDEERYPVRTRRGGPEAEQVKQTPKVPLTSGNIRYTGHKEIKLTLNKSVTKTNRAEPSKPPSHNSLPERTEASSSSEKQPAAKKRQRDPSPVFDSSNHAKEAVSSSVTPQSANKPDKRPADSQAEPVTSGKPNNTSSRREELLRELKAVEDAIAKKRARIE